MSEARKIHVSGSGLTRSDLLRLGLVRPLDAAQATPLPAPKNTPDSCDACGRTTPEMHFVAVARTLLCARCWREMRNKPAEPREGKDHV